MVVRSGIEPPSKAFQTFANPSQLPYHIKRSLAGSNCCRGFCRALPSHSAKGLYEAKPIIEMGTHLYKRRILPLKLFGLMSSEQGSNPVTKLSRMSDSNGSSSSQSQCANLYTTSSFLFLCSIV